MKTSGFSTNISVYLGNIRGTGYSYIHCESKTLDPFSFEHNFGKYCPILITFLLFQTEINCDQVYPNIYHQTLNMLVHYLVK